MEDYKTWINELTDSQLELQQRIVDDSILDNYQYQEYIVDNLKIFKNYISKIEDSEIKVNQNITYLGTYSRKITDFLKELEINMQDRKILDQKKLIVVKQLMKRGKLK